MSVLSAQSIRLLCTDPFYIKRAGGPLISPFVEPEFAWMSTPLDSPWELSPYRPSWVGSKPSRELYQQQQKLWWKKPVVRGKSFGLSACTYDCRISDRLTLPIGQGRLAATIESFNIPTNVCGSVLDKSSWARVFVTAFNTHLDPGWGPRELNGKNHLTVELVNLGDEVVEYYPGDPLCQVKFEWLDAPTELPYKGKYLGQGAAPTPAIYEGHSDDK
jgi:dCTP deaminase